MSHRTDHIARHPDWIHVIVTHVADGDTVRVHARLGLGVELTAEYVRLLGIQAPELRGQRHYIAQEARRRLSAECLACPCLLHLPGHDRDRYGRWLGYLWRIASDHLVCLNRLMVDEGLAHRWAPRRHRHGDWLPPLAAPLPSATLADEPSS